MSGTPDWYEDDGFWRDFHSALFSAERQARAPDEVAGALRLAGVDAQRVLDLGCGPGRHCVHLARRGLTVTGVDISGELLAQARANAAAAAVDLELVAADMREFQRRDAFDLIINLWTSFGYSARAADDTKVLQRCHENLRNGGALVIDLLSKEYAVRHLESPSVREVEGGRYLIERPRLVDDMSVLENDWILVSGDNVHRKSWRQSVYSGRELKDRLYLAGFESVSLYGDLSGSPFDLDAERLVAVAWK